MAISTTKLGLVASGAIVLTGSAWAFAGGSEEAAEEQQLGIPGIVFEADSPERDADTSDGDLQIKGSVVKLDILVHDGPNKEKAVSGEIFLSAGYGRTFDKNISDHLGRSGSTGDVEAVAVSSSAVARDYEEPTPEDTMANDNFEIVLDYAANRRFMIDPVRKEVEEQPLYASPGRPNTILADAQSKDPEAARRLKGLLGQLTQPRLDPKRKLRLIGELSAGKSMLLNEVSVPCLYSKFTSPDAGVGEVCYADITDENGLRAVRAILVNYPLPAAGKKDELARLRQLAEIGGTSRFPVSYKIDYSGFDGGDYDVDLVGFTIVRDPPANLFDRREEYRQRKMPGLR